MGEEHIMLLQINTLHCLRKELDHKGGQKYGDGTFIVHTAVGKKVHFRMKQCSYNGVAFFQPFWVFVPFHLWIFSSKISPMS